MASGGEEGEEGWMEEPEEDKEKEGEEVGREGGQELTVMGEEGVEEGVEDREENEEGEGEEEGQGQLWGKENSPPLQDRPSAGGGKDEDWHPYECIDV